MSDLARLIGVLEGIGDVGIAVSGGVDSMTLAQAAHLSHARSAMFHAVSPAVPTHATQRVQDCARRHGWDLAIVGAGEFDDPAYVNNPVNRCYFCKSNLYGRLRAATDAVICSGTNTDDLGDFRPGLTAAAEQSVRHPFVEAGIAKSGVRALAKSMGLNDLAELPAQPCLSSRVETGLAIDPADLAMIDRIERWLTDRLGPGDIRCRVTRSGLRIELPAASDLKAPVRQDLEQEITAQGYRLAGITAYRRGSAFLREGAS